jgi:hypothetical protein
MKMNYGETKKKYSPMMVKDETTQCLTDASYRESNVNALCGKSPGFFDFVHLLIR